MRVLFAGVAALLLLTAPDGEARAESAPRVTSFTIAGGERYPFNNWPLDKMSQVAIFFDQPVQVTGRPQLTVEVGEQRRNLDLLTGYATSPGGAYYYTRRPIAVLIFEYYVRASERGSVVATGIALNGGTIRSATGEDANLVFENMVLVRPTTNNAPITISVDGSRRHDWSRDNGNNVPHCYLTEYNVPQSGTTYRVGEEIQMQAYCIVPVTVTGTPQVPLIIGARTRYANYVPALSAASHLIFSYTVQETDFDNNGIQHGGPTPWRMNGGSVVLRGHNTPVRLVASNSEGATGNYQTNVCCRSPGHPDADRLGYRPTNVNGGGSGTGEANLVATPGVSSVEFSSSPQYENTYDLGEMIRVRVRFSAPVTVTGTPQLGLTIGSQTRQATYDAGWTAEVRGDGEGEDILVFTYTVQATDFDADGISIAANALALNSGTITNADDSATAASLVHAAVPTNSAHKVDGSTDVVEHGDSREQATLLNVAPAQAWVHFYCGRGQDAEAAACTAQVQCGPHDGSSVAWDVEVAPETIVSYWPGRTAADGTSANFAAALVAAGRPEAEARQRTTCRVFSPDPLEVRAYTQVGGDVVPVAESPAPLDTTAPTRVATLLNVAPAHALVHLSCRKAPAAAEEPADPCNVRLQCGQQEGTPVAWEVTVAAETTMTYGPGGASDDLAAALVTAGKTEAEARRRTTCQVFSPDPLDAWAYTRFAGDLVSVTNPPAAVDAGAPTRVATLLNVAPAQAWVHFYCRKAHDPAAETADPCNVRLQCGQQAGVPVAWDVEVAPETIVTYWPGRTADDGTPADFAAALVAAGKTEAEARRRTTCQVFSTDPVDVRGYTQVGGAVVPVANPPVMPAADAPPTRIGTLLNLAPAQAWVHFYCRKVHQPEAETADPCNVRLQCGQRDGTSVGWDVEVAPETIMSYWPGRTAADGTSDNLAAALVAAGKTEAEARRRTTCQVFSADPVDVRGYTQLGETVVPVKN